MFRWTVASHDARSWFTLAFRVLKRGRVDGSPEPALSDSVPEPRARCFATHTGRVCEALPDRIAAPFHRQARLRGDRHRFPQSFLRHRCRPRRARTASGWIAE